MTTDQRETVFKFGPILTLIIALIGCTWTVTNHLAALDKTISEIANRVESVEKNSFTIPMAEASALRTAILNPGTRVPDPRDPTKVITVRSAQIGD